PPVESHPGQLGDRLRRVLLPGAGQPVGLRSVYGGPAEDDPGNDHAGGVLRLLGAVFEGRLEVELPGGIRPHDRRRLLRLQEMGLRMADIASRKSRFSSLEPTETRRAFGSLFMLT